MKTTMQPSYVELEQRTGDGLTVTLLWSPESKDTKVRIENARTGADFEFAVPPERAHDAFNHPFAYAPDGADATIKE